MKSIAVYIIIAFLLLSCSGKEGHIAGSRVVEVTRSISGVSENSKKFLQQDRNVVNNDSLRLLKTLEEMIDWAGTDEFSSMYSASAGSKDYSNLDNRLASILRANGYSSCEEFELYCGRLADDGFLKLMSDSLRSVTNDRIRKINKEKSGKNK